MATLFTPRGFEELEATIKRTQKQLSGAIKEKGESAAGQDGWHDEGYKIANVEEMMWSKRLRELQELKIGARIVIPEEQNKQVRIGNGVRLRYPDGTERKYLIDGYGVSSAKNRISFNSPLGKILMGAHRNDTVVLIMGKEKTKIVIIDIVLPSQAEAFLSKGQMEDKQRT